MWAFEFRMRHLSQQWWQRLCVSQRERRREGRVSSWAVAQSRALSLAFQASMAPTVLNRQPRPCFFGVSTNAVHRLSWLWLKSSPTPAPAFPPKLQERLVRAQPRFLPRPMVPSGVPCRWAPWSPPDLTGLPSLETACSAVSLPLRPPCRLSQPACLWITGDGENATWAFWSPATVVSRTPGT